MNFAGAANITYIVHRLLHFKLESAGGKMKKFLHLNCLFTCLFFVFVANTAIANVYVVGGISDNIVVFDNAGGYLTSVALPSGSGSAGDIAQAPNGDFFVLRGGGSIHRFDSNLNFIETWSSFSPAYGINVDESGLVYVAGSGSPSVGVYNASGVLQASLTPSSSSNLRDSVRVNGNTWVSNFNGSKIDVFDAGGADIGDVSSPPSPFGMQKAPNGDVWVVDQDTHEVRRITPAGSQAFSFDADNGPNGGLTDQLRYVGVNPTGGQLYISRRDETRIDVYSETGVYQGVLSHASLNGPDGIIVTASANIQAPAAIPTLSEWGLILLSSLLVFGAIFTLRRQ